MRKNDKQPINDNFEWHGYHQWYSYNNSIMLRVMYKNDKEVGYEEYHDSNVDSADSTDSVVNFYIR